MFALLLLSLCVYGAAGLIATALCSSCRAKRVRVSIAGAIVGAIAAFSAPVLFAPAVGPTIAGIYIVPGVLVAIAAVAILEYVACRISRNRRHPNNVVELQQRSQPRQAA